METVLSRPLARLERLCAEVRNSDELIDVTGRHLAEVTGAEAHVFMRMDPMTALYVGARDAGHAEWACQAFKETAYLRSDLTDYGHLARGAQRVFAVERADQGDDPYRAVFMRDMDFHHELHASYAHGGQAYGHLIVSKRKEAFGTAAARFLEQSVPVLTGALRRLLAKDTLEAVPGDHVGLLTVGPDGRMTAANVTGEVILRNVQTKLGRYAQNDALAIAAELAARALRTGDGAPLPRLVYVDPASRQRYRLITEPMLHQGAEPRALLMAEPIRALDSVELLRTAGLTEREAEVAIVTLRGFKSAEGAEALRLSEHTFLSHLKSVYRRLGVSSRSELAALLLGGH